MRVSRSSKGSTLALIITCCVLLVALMFGIYELSMLFGGGQEIRNSVDSGALNVGQQTLSFKTSAQDNDEHQFDDVADSKGEFSLSNINRVWGKVLLVYLNASSMNRRNTATTSTAGNADLLYKAAERISDRIQAQITDPERLKPFFEKMTQQNSTRMIGPSSAVKASADSFLNTSYVDRGAESNINFDPAQLPPETDPNAIKGVKGSDNNLYFPGYTGFQLLDKTLYLIPFKANETTHLVSTVGFSANTLPAKPLPGWSKPLPNAFSAQGQIPTANGKTSTSISYVQTNPQRSFSLSIPHGFVRITLHKPLAKVSIGIPGLFKFKTSSENYTYTHHQNDYLPPNVIANLGYEVSSRRPSVWECLYVQFGNPGYEAEKKILVQRLKEIKPDFTEQQLQPLLSQTGPWGAYNGDDYYFYVCLNSVGDLVMRDGAEITAQAPWMSTHLSDEPDGGPEDIAAEKLGSGGNSAYATPLQPDPLAPLIYPKCEVNTHGLHIWKSSTGFNGLLGELRLERYVDILEF